MTLSANASLNSEMNEIFGDSDEAEVIVLLKDSYRINTPNSLMASRDKVLIGYNWERLSREMEIENADFELTNVYPSFNGFAGKIKKSQYNELAGNLNVVKIVRSGTKELFLKESVAQINTTQVWNTAVNNIPVKGRGETICALDTGVDYTHPAL